MRDPRNKQLASTMFPVQYSDRRIDVTPFLESQFQKLMDTMEQTMKKGGKTIVVNDLSLVFMTCLFVFIKHSSWSYEKEFRNSVGVNIFKTDATPKEIFLGANCTPEHSDKLITVAHQLKVPVYRMNMDEYSPDFRLKPTRI